MSEASNQVDMVIERMLREWKRGMLTYWVLGQLTIQPMYGLELKNKLEQRTQGKMTVRASSIYQLLRRLEKRGLIESRWEQTTLGPPRAYYETTDAGREVVQRYLEEVFSPGSPIAAAMGELTGQLFQFFQGNTFD